MKRLITAFLVVILSLSLNVGSAVALTTDSKLVPGDGATGDYFGYSVAVSGDTAVVGAHFDDDNGNSSGSAYVFLRSGENWIQQAKLTAADGTAGELFGYSVAISGDTVAVGAYGDDENGYYSGSVYVFVRNDGSWSQQAKLKAGDGETSDYFGYSLAISGDTLVVGAYGDDDSGSLSGSAYVFVREGISWSEQAKLLAGDGSPFYHFGRSVAIDSDVVVVGSYRIMEGESEENSDAAYVFVRSDGSWSQQTKLTASDGVDGDLFGYSVTISGNTTLVGAPADNLASGSVYVFVNTGGVWNEEIRLTAVDGEAGDFLGCASAFGGDTAVIGACYDNSISGSAYVFVRSEGSWSQQAKLTAGDGAAGDEFGSSVALSGDTALIGAYGDDDNGSSSGSAYVCELSVNVPPVADAGGPYTVLEGGVLVLDASGSYDSNDDIALYEWDLDNDGEYDDAVGITVTTVYDDDGVYDVGLRVTDGFEEFDMDAASVTVENAPPQLDAGPDFAVDLGDTVSVNAEFTDPGILDTHTATISWGDGISEPAALTEPGLGPGIVAGSHVYSWPGTYEVIVEVLDDDLAASVDAFMIEVRPVPVIMTENLLNNDLDHVDLPNGTVTGLTASLHNVTKVLEDSNPKNDVSAINALEAFINKLDAQSGKKIPAEIADELIAKAQEIIAALSGGT